MMSANLRAFLALIRWCEGTDDEGGYSRIVGGSSFGSWDDHPRVVKSGTFRNGKAWSSSAAGAYQFLSRTWDEAKAALDLPDFSPESQDKAAIWLIQRRGALHAVEVGDLDEAIRLCNKEWASLPGAPYGQPVKTLEACRRVFVAAGGHLMQATAPSPASVPSPAPVPEPAPYPASGDEPFPDWPFPSTNNPPGNPMPLPAAAVVALGAELLKLLPMFSSGSKSSERNVAVAQTLGNRLLEVAKEVTPVAVNEQEAVEQIMGSRELQDRFRAQAVVKWDDLAPMMEFEAKERKEARDFAERMTSSGPMWRQIGYGALIGILALMILGGSGLLFYEVLFAAEGFDPSTKAGIIEIIKAIAVLVVGFFFGSSASSRGKDQAIADQAAKR